MSRAPAEHVYAPRGAALDLFGHREPEVLLSGSAGTGKSRACLEKLHALALMNPGMRGLIVRKTLSSLGSTALVTWREHVIKEALNNSLVKFYGGSAEQPAQYRYSNGSVIIVGGMDKATRIMSSEYDVIFCQEAIELTENDWESLTTRLRNGKISFQQIMADTNPDTPTHWLKQRCNRGQTVCLESRHEDNPVLFDDNGELTESGKAYLSILDALTGPRYQRLRKGLWVAAEGIIYEEWDAAVHLVDQYEIPSTWPRYWSVDFGFVHPFVLQCWAEDPDGRLTLYREIFHTGRTVDQHAAKILSYVTDRRGQWTEPKPTAVICDHDAEGRATLSKSLGLGTVAARKAVLEGIQGVQRRLRPAGDGRPRLFIMRNCTVERDISLIEAKKPASTEEEFSGYVWDRGQGKGKEAPVKEFDDGMDTCRYVVAHRDKGSNYRVRFAG